MALTLQGYNLFLGTPTYNSIRFTFNFSVNLKHLCCFIFDFIVFVKQWVNFCMCLCD